MKVPKYSHHKGTGQAYVKLGKKLFYLGAWGSEESRQRYETTIGGHLSRGRKPPTKNAQSAKDTEGIKPISAARRRRLDVDQTYTNGTRQSRYVRGDVPKLTGMS